MLRMPSIEFSWCAYSRAWSRAFAMEKLIIKSNLADGELLRIEHIGSTSVPDMGGKPYVDIALKRPLPASLKLSTALQDGGCGYMRSSPGGNWFIKDARKPTKHIQGFVVHVLDDYHFKRCCVFRNYLRSHPVDRRTYGDLKRELVQEVGRGGPGALQYTAAKRTKMSKFMLKVNGGEGLRRLTHLPHDTTLHHTPSRECTQP